MRTEATDGRSESPARRASAERAGVIGAIVFVLVSLVLIATLPPVVARCLSTQAEEATGRRP